MRGSASVYTNGWSIVVAINWLAQMRAVFKQWTGKRVAPHLCTVVPARIIHINWMKITRKTKAWQ